MALFTKDQLYTHNGIRRTKALFREYCNEVNVHQAIFCSNKYDRDNVRSLYKLYMEHAVEDVTEVEFALHVFGEVAFWEYLKTKPPVNEWYGEWVAEAEKRRKSLLIRTMIECTRDEKTKFQATKYLLDRGNDMRANTRDARKLRKDTKEEIEDILNSDAFADDLRRLKELDTLESD